MLAPEGADPATAIASSIRASDRHALAETSQPFDLLRQREALE
jgi:hypothetical protein